MISFHSYKADPLQTNMQFVVYVYLTHLIINPWDLKHMVSKIKPHATSDLCRKC